MGILTLLLSTMAFTAACSTNNGSKYRDNKSKSLEALALDPFVKEFPEVTISDVSKNSFIRKFRSGDSAEIEVYNVEALSSTYIVDSMGNVAFPLIGQIRVEGLTSLELRDTLTERYGQKYLQSPNIIVRLEGGDLGSIVVDGAVKKPGVFEIDRIMRLSEVIALAEGINEDADRDEVYVVRKINNERLILKVNYNDIRKKAGNDPAIIPNDAIFVQDSTGRVLFREFVRTIPLLNTLIILSR